MYRHVRGKCVIINNEIVDGMPMRYGTETDGRLLQQLFRQLHFQVEELNNVTAAVSIAQQNNLCYDCVTSSMLFLYIPTRE